MIKYILAFILLGNCSAHQPFFDKNMLKYRKYFKLIFDEKYGFDTELNYFLNYRICSEKFKGKKINLLVTNEPKRNNHFYQYYGHRNIANTFFLNQILSNEFKNCGYILTDENYEYKLHFHFIYFGYIGSTRFDYILYPLLSIDQLFIYGTVSILDEKDMLVKTESLAFKHPLVNSLDIFLLSLLLDERRKHKSLLIRQLLFIYINAMSDLIEENIK